MPGTLPATRDTAVNKTDQVLALHGLHSLEEGNQSGEKKNVRGISEIELTELDYIPHVGWRAS